MRARSAERRSLSSAATAAALALATASAAHAHIPTSTTAAPTNQAVRTGGDGSECSSLNGPFCLAIGATTQFASYMTPISVDSLYDAAAREESAALDSIVGAKQCFFQHFSRSWMDSGGDEFDLMNKDVRSVDECEALCCAHPQCQSFSFWMGHTCFLRSRRSTPRSESNSFSGNRIG